MIAEPLSSTSTQPHAEAARQATPLFANEIIYAAACNVGMGVFANREIAPWEVILEFGGPIIDFAETKRRGPRECMAIQIGEDRYFDTRAPGVLVNHSCFPNAGIMWDRFLVALRPIRKGQEIRFDYSTTMQEQSFTMTCLCGDPHCRGEVRDFSTLPREVQSRYLSQGIVMSFIVDKLGAAASAEGTTSRTQRRRVASEAPVLAFR